MSYEEVDNIYSQIKRETAFAHLRDYDNRFVPGEGNADNPIAFIIGEAPGAQEAIKHRPFIGPAGKVQRELMGFAGLLTHIIDMEPPYHRDDQSIPNCWLTNVLHYRPPANRNPLPSEITVARPYIEQEWRAVGKPMIMIPVGRIALEAIIGKPISILKVSGRPMVFTTKDDQKMTVWPMIHPSFGLRNKAIQPLIERDWQRLARWLNAANR